MSQAPPRPRKRRPPVFPRPFASLAIVYIFGFWFLYLLAFAAPTLWEIQNTIPVGPEQERAAQEATRAALSGRVTPALLLSLATVVLGVWTKKLPGFKDPLRQ